MNEFLNLVWEVVDSCTNVKWVLFTVTTWSLWNNRNFVIHGGNSKGKEGLINSVVGYVEEIKSEKTTQRRVHSSVAQNGLHRNKAGIRLIRMVQCSGKRDAVA